MVTAACSLLVACVLPTHSTCSRFIPHLLKPGKGGTDCIDPFRPCSFTLDFLRRGALRRSEALHPLQPQHVLPLLLPRAPPPFHSRPPPSPSKMRGAPPGDAAGDPGGRCRRRGASEALSGGAEPPAGGGREGGFRVPGCRSGFRVAGSGLRVSDSGVRVPGSGCGRAPCPVRSHPDTPPSSC